MKLTLIHPFLWPLAPLVDGTLRGILLEQPDGLTEPEHLARESGWDVDKVKRLLAHPPVPDLDGPVILSMTYADIKGLSLLRATHRIEAIIVAAVSHLWRVNLLGRVIGRPEHDVRRIQKRAVNFGFLAPRPVWARSGRCERRNGPSRSGEPITS